MMFMNINIDNQDHMNHTAISLSNYIYYIQRNAALEKSNHMHADQIYYNREKAKVLDETQRQNMSAYKLQQYSIRNDLEMIECVSQNTQADCINVHALPNLDDHIKYLLKDYPTAYCVRCTRLEAFDRSFIIYLSASRIAENITDIKYCYDCQGMDIFFNNKPGCNMNLMRYVRDYKNPIYSYNQRVLDQDIIRSILKAGGYLLDEYDTD